MLYTSPMNRTIVEEIKARIPIEELISSYVKVDKSGRSYKARCPFHNEKTASFFISPERGGYYCFGCGAKGDIFSLNFLPVFLSKLNFIRIEVLAMSMYFLRGNFQKMPN
jgi:hypothetical protein